MLLAEKYLGKMILLQLTPLLEAHEETATRK
jgi:hypothetical protein